MVRLIGVGASTVESAIKKNTSSSRGFVMTSLMVLIPLFISIMFLFFALTYGVYHHTRAYSLCYKTGTRIQTQLKQKLKQLMSFNKKAQKLRFKRKKASAYLKKAILSLNPINISTAQKKLSLIIAQQKVLSLKQSAILIKGRGVIQKEWLGFRRGSKKWIQNSRKIKIHNPLAVQKKPKMSASPSYFPMLRFSENQKITIEWTMNIFQFLPLFIREKFYFNKSFKHYCSVSLKNQAQDFSINLMK